MIVDDGIRGFHPLFIIENHAKSLQKAIKPSFQLKISKIPPKKQKYPKRKKKYKIMRKRRKNP